MSETQPIEPITEPVVTAPAAHGFRFYAQGSIEFFKKMWPAIFDLTTTETYVNASAIAFNVVLSLFSFVVLIGTFLSKVLHWRSGYESFYYLLRSLVPKESVMLFTSLDRVTQGPGGKATVFSFGLMIFSASGVFQPLEAALNRAWGFKERHFVRQYAVYLALVIICVLIILVPVALGGAYNALLVWIFGKASPVTDTFFKIIGPILWFPFIVAIFFVVYFYVPNGKVQPNQVLFTSVATAVLWMIATFGFWLALPLFDFKESYEQLAPLMALVTWVFISSFILILGANLSAKKILPTSWTH